MDTVKIFLYEGMVQFFRDDEEQLAKVDGFTYAKNFSEAAAVLEQEYEEEGYELFHLEMTECPPHLFHELGGTLLQ